MELIIKIIAIIWTILLCLCIIGFTLSIRDIGLTYVFLTWLFATIVFSHIASLWYVGTFYPPVDDFINSTEILDELSEPEDKSLSELEGEDEFSKQKKARNKFLRKLFFIYFIAYFGFFR